MQQLQWRRLSDNTILGFVQRYQRWMNFESFEAYFDYVSDG